ncbi:hypothetical protein SARC_09374 [Sphaeroforma arctica JP610]|uniref:Uncharacterized protein n=1 Tax=Sphaeroforma arctica JP610 TaxID=667725 RepID=A0A0L0FNZ6_9EUKA|nr:hypothetical protein SARC_09374 [Sphaeroforma arctica JP610]KNC78191.1 hypothetical protein SARC_09374 [Sphaeroforma arctica JP610]|eukprot:XP_014152093.1 hypothetical protein SARC_09374 [Sphaeroforma arctica JP610]
MLSFIIALAAVTAFHSGALHPSASAIDAATNADPVDTSPTATASPYFEIYANGFPAFPG